MENYLLPDPKSLIPHEVSSDTPWGVLLQKINVWSSGAVRMK